METPIYSVCLVQAWFFELRSGIFWFSLKKMWSQPLSHGPSKRYRKCWLFRWTSPRRAKKRIDQQPPHQPVSFQIPRLCKPHCWGSDLEAKPSTIPAFREMAGDVRGESFPNHLHHEKLMNPTWKTPTLRWRARDPWNPGLKMKIQLVAMDVWMFIHSCGKITSRFWPIPSISCTSGLLGFDHGPSHSVSATETRWFSGQYMPSRPFRSFLVIGQSVWHSTW